MKTAVVICPSAYAVGRTFNDVLWHLSEHGLVPAGSRIDVDKPGKRITLNGWSIRFLMCRASGSLSYLNVDYTVPYRPEAEKDSRYAAEEHTMAGLMAHVLGRKNVW